MENRDRIPLIGVLAIRPIVLALRARQIDVAEFMARVGLPNLPVDDAEARLPLACLDQTWEHAARILCDPYLGLHLSQNMSDESFGLLSYLGVTSATWGEGLRRVCAHFRLLSDGSGYLLDVRGPQAVVTAYQHTKVRGPVRQRVEFTIGVLHSYACQTLRARWQVLDVFFEHPAPTDVQEHRRMFRCIPRFGAAASGLSFAAALLDEPLLTHDPALLAVLETAAHRLVPPVPQAPSVTSTLEDLVLRRGFEAALGIESAARQLGLSVRTLQRRLHTEHTSHQRVLDTLRRNAALRMLAEPSHSIAEVAFSLGFSTPEAFCRAFRRWQGMTPHAHRRACVCQGTAS